MVGSGLHATVIKNTRLPQEALVLKGDKKIQTT
jgi:hypothetical protein